MAAIRSQFLFAYGTLRAEEQESSLHGPVRLSASPAKAPGSLYTLKEGYPIMLVEPNIKVVTASYEWDADWELACSRLESCSYAYAKPPSIEGELIEIPLESNAFDKSDTWEGFSVGSNSVYQRMVIPVRRNDGRILPAWVYACLAIPAEAAPFNGNRWKLAERLYGENAE
tara:strand:+ start:1317 stop:1829 length:513 start_codon:yes stop_codon:yes gene_type:complete